LPLGRNDPLPLHSSKLPPFHASLLVLGHIILAIATTTLVFTIPENAYSIVYARYVLGYVFVLLLPGYALTKALFPTKEFDNIERTALSIGMSLALVIITGLLLNYAHGA